MKNVSPCKECPYFWKDEDEDWAQCHYNSLGAFDPAPCEEENSNEES